MKIKNEQLEPLEYIAKLQGRSVDALVGEILEDWLMNNYCDTAVQGEAERGLLPTAIFKRGKLDQDAAYRKMRENMRALAAGECLDLATIAANR